MRNFKQYFTFIIVENKAEKLPIFIVKYFIFVEVQASFK